MEGAPSTPDDSSGARTSDRPDERSGAAEHAREDREPSAIVGVKVGLAGEAVRGTSWAGHRARLVTEFVDLLSPDVMGLYLVEVGSRSDRLTEEDKAAVDELLEEAFRTAGATEHGAPQISWITGESVAAFRAEIVLHETQTGIPAVTISMPSPARTPP